MVDLDCRTHSKTMISRPVKADHLRRVHHPLFESSPAESFQAQWTASTVRLLLTHSTHTATQSSNDRAVRRLSRRRVIRQILAARWSAVLPEDRLEPAFPAKTPGQ